MYHKLIAEFLGTAFFSFVIFASGFNWLMIGSALALVILCIGKISGAAINPAISFAFYHSGKISQTELFGYIIVEMLGALAGYELFKRYVH